MHQHISGTSNRIDRRGFLGMAAVAGGAAGLGVLGLAGPVMGRTMRRWDEPGKSASAAVGEMLKLDEKFASVKQLATWASGGVWAIQSVIGNHFTICNGGIIAAKDTVTLVEGFGTIDGAEWAAAIAKQVTGREVTHVVVTHNHFDHTDGLGGYLGLKPKPTIISTQTTRDLLMKRAAVGVNPMFPPAASSIKGVKQLAGNYVLPDAVIEDISKLVDLDLGDGRKVSLKERVGHTASDLTIEISGALEGAAKIVFGGDLFFNKMFPFFGDATLSSLRRNVAEMIGANDGKDVIVPGHGDVTTGAELKTYLAFLDYVLEQVKKAHVAGTPPKAAADAFKVPESMKDYGGFLGGPVPANIVQFAFEAWEREVGGGK